MTVLTMSAVPRTLACPASMVLPHTPYSNEFSEAGVVGHNEMESAAINREWHKLPPIVQDLLTAYDADHVYPELGLVYNYVLNTGRVIDRMAARDYRGIEPYEIPGTADLVAVDARRRRGLVVDYKRFEEVGHPSVNTQTLGYAAALARAFDLDEVDVAIAYLGEGKRYTETATLDGVDFDAHRIRLMTLDTTIAGARVDPNAYLQTGRHCRWCPAFHACPEQAALALELKTDPEVIERQLPLDNDEFAANAYAFLARIKILSKRLSDAVYARAAERPIPIGNGKVLGRVEKRGNLQLDADTVYQVMRAMHGQEAADASVRRTASQSGIEEALKLRGENPISKAKEFVLKRVEELGGTSRKPSTAIEEYTVCSIAEVTP